MRSDDDERSDNKKSDDDKRSDDERSQNSEIKVRKSKTRVMSRWSPWWHGNRRFSS